MFRGTYQQISSDGLPVGYIFGDVVSYEGNLYKAISETCLSPQQDPTSWSYFGTSNIYFSSTPPLNPQIGQQWSNGARVYTYYYDGNNYSWVEYG